MTDPEFAATYNYVVTSTMPTGIFDIAGGVNFAITGLGHFIFDMAPYYIMGNERGAY